jgi:hypothetical protein
MKSVPMQVGPSRRLMMLRAGGALAAATVLPVVASATPASDPVLTALSAYEQALADFNVAARLYGALETKHPDVVFYKPRVKVSTRFSTYGDDAGVEYPTYVHNEAEIRQAADNLRWDDASLERCVARLEDDRIRHQTELDAIGLPLADRRAKDAAGLLSVAEAAVLNAMPTTDEGAIALAEFAARAANDDFEHDFEGAFRSLAAHMIRRCSGAGV